MVEATADELAPVDPRIGRTHDTAVQHAGDTDIVDISECPHRLCRDVDARDWPSDNAMVRDGLQFHAVRKRQVDAAIAQEIGEGQRNAGITARTYHGVDGREIFNRLG
jgi:hypothetical protein